MRGERDRRRVRVVLRRSPILAGALIAASTIGSIAQPNADAPGTINATLSTRVGKPPLITLVGISEHHPSVDRYRITGYLRRVPCSGTKYRLVIVQALGAARATYAATLALGKQRGSPIRCNVPLPRNLGRRTHGVDIRIYREGSTVSNSAITVKARRRDATRIEGSLTTNVLVCRDARLRIRLSSRSLPVVLLYDVRFSSVSINGGRFNSPHCS